MAPHYTILLWCNYSKDINLLSSWNQYACRKTLADSRPRIRGRFARNDEIDKNPPVQWSHIGAAEEEDEENQNWVGIFDSLVAANLDQESQGSSSFGLLY